MNARIENERTLRALMGIDAADTVLDATAAITCEESEATGAAEYTAQLLARTVSRVQVNRLDAADVEIVVGKARPRTAAPKVYFTARDGSVVITREEVANSFAAVHRIFALMGACHAAAGAVSVLAGINSRHVLRAPIELRISDLGRGEDLDAPRRFGRTYLAGAGAVGNAFLLGLSAFDVSGEVQVVDPDLVSAGNLNRAFWFQQDDVDVPKAEALVRRASARVPGVALVPRVCRLQDVEERSAGPWLERLVVGVDSRRARRRLQDELPRDVFDASTTGVEEVVVSFCSGRSDRACLGCLYPADPVEAAHEAHVAAVLGVEGSDVAEHLVSARAARAIVQRYPHLGVEAVTGLAYDSLFKQLCSAGELKVDQERQVLAPFAFVSALAGAYLALEFFLRVGAGDVSLPFNFWRISPWASPVLPLRSQRRRRECCECCDRDAVRATVRTLWGAVHEQGSSSP